VYKQDVIIVEGKCGGNGDENYLGKIIFKRIYYNVRYFSKNSDLEKAMKNYSLSLSVSHR
jgi:hypothetical protein